MVEINLFYDLMIDSFIVIVLADALLKLNVREAMST